MTKTSLNDMLDDLIIKYNIDKHHSRFRKKKKAEEILLELFENIKSKNVILIGNCNTDIQFIKETIPYLSNTKSIILEDVFCDNIDQNISSFDYVIIVSFNWFREMLNKIKRLNKNTISIYNYFLENNFQLNHPYYDIFGIKYHTIYGKKSYDYENFDNNANIFYDLKCYEIESSLVLKKIYLEKLIFDCIYIRDFIFTKKYINIYIDNNFDTERNYSNFYKELDKLINYIKIKLENNKKRHINLFWLDALEYGEEKDMPFLMDIAEKGIKFENAYTVTPYTHFTIKTMFLKKYAVDDKSYLTSKVSLDNSEILKFLKNYKYNFLYYGFSNQFDNDLKEKSFINRYTTASILYWKMLTNLVDNNNKLYFSLIHEVMETHSPFISPAINSNDYYFKDFADNDEINYRYKNYAPASRKYIDDQLRFYTELLGNSMTNIYMSDHGHSFYGRFHTVLNIYGKGIKKEKYNKLFSYYNFDELIHYIVKLDDEILDNNIFSDYVKIQDVDYYNKRAILKWMDKNNFGGLYAIGYRGVITQKDMMIIFNNGQSEYFQIANNSIIQNNRINYLITLIGDNKIDIYKDDFFKYSRYVYKVFENYENRVGSLLKRKIDMLCKMIIDIPKNKTVAIRCGGENTRKLFWSIDDNCKSRISYIIDKERNCLSSKLGIPVILPEEIKTKKIDVIIISCYPMPSAIVNEKNQLLLKYEVIDMYEYLINSGFDIKSEFYREPYEDSDFDFIREKSDEDI